MKAPGGVRRTGLARWFQILEERFMTLFWANLLCVAWALPFLTALFFFLQTWDWLSGIGVVLGTACMVDGLIERYREELGDVPTIVACGGLSPAIVPHCRTNIILDQDLLLDGLLAIYRRNTPPKQH